MNRHNARIIAVLTLFKKDISHLNDEDTLLALDDILNLEKEEEYPADIDEEYSRKLINGILPVLPEVDVVISKYLVNYTIDRLSYVDRAIIRLATYEMIYLGLPHPIAINEALEITKDYSNLEDNKQVKFNNRVLDNISNGLKDKDAHE